MTWENGRNHQKNHSQNAHPLGKQESLLFCIANLLTTHRIIDLKCYKPSCNCGTMSGLVTAFRKGFYSQTGYGLTEYLPSRVGLLILKYQNHFYHSVHHLVHYLLSCEFVHGFLQLQRARKRFISFVNGQSLFIVIDFLTILI